MNDFPKVKISSLADCFVFCFKKRETLAWRSDALLESQESKG